MAIQEALSIVVKKDDLSADNEQIEKSSTLIALKYLFDCYSRVEEEERQYPKVKLFGLKLFLLFIIFIC